MPDPTPQSPNPFAAPQVDERPLPFEGADIEDSRMPGSVVLAVACVVTVLLFNLLFLAGSAFAGDGVTAFYLGGLLVGVLVLVGLIRRHRLAWQWGRIIGFISATLATISLVGSAVGLAILLQDGGIAADVDDPAFRVGLLMSIGVGLVIVCLPTAVLWALFASLGLVTARRYFRLICPSCGGRRVRAVGFLFGKARCRRCQTVW